MPSSQEWQALDEAIDAFDEEDELPPASCDVHALLLVNELADKARHLRTVARAVLDAHDDEGLSQEAREPARMTITGVKFGRIRADGTHIHIEVKFSVGGLWESATTIALSEDTAQQLIAKVQDAIAKLNRTRLGA